MLKTVFQMQGVYKDLFGGLHTYPITRGKLHVNKRVINNYPDIRKISTPLLINPQRIEEYQPFEGGVPSKLLDFGSCLNSSDFTSTVHFYIYDRLFTRILVNPEKYTEALKKFNSIIAPDFSLRVGMSVDEILYSLAATRAVARFFHNKGVNVIPNVQWCIPDLYDVCFSGIPRKGIVAVNCTGIIGCDVSKYLWMKGYEELLKRIDPCLIIRYGDKMPDEDVSRSFYFPNERLLRLRKGGVYGG